MLPGRLTLLLAILLCTVGALESAKALLRISKVKTESTQFVKFNITLQNHENGSFSIQRYSSILKVIDKQMV